jgi:hypothetical protein
MQAISSIDRRPIEHHSLAKPTRRHIHLPHAPEIHLHHQSPHLLGTNHAPPNALHPQRALAAPPLPSPPPYPQPLPNQSPSLHPKSHHTPDAPHLPLHTPRPTHATSRSSGRWHAAFLELYARVRSRLRDAQFAGAVALQLRLKTARVAICCCLGWS